MSDASDHDNNLKIVIKYAVVGSGEGVRRFIGKNIAEDEKVDFGASDAAMSDAEIARADNNALMVPVTAGCVVLAYSLPGVQSSSFRAGLIPGSFLARSKSGTIR